MNEENSGKNLSSPRKLLEELGLAPQKGRGQNFLKDPQTAAGLVARGRLPMGPPILEIGPGLGALTRPLLAAGHRIVALEVDRGLASYLIKELAPLAKGRLEVLTADALETDWVAAVGEDRFSLVGNLPYLISSPLLIRMVALRRHVIRAVLTFQTELAERLEAGPGCKAYGRLSVLLGYFAKVERLMDLSPQVFFPKPKVGSTVVGIEFRSAPTPELKDGALFERVVAAAFSRRRKTLANALKSSFSVPEITGALARAGVDPGRRAETLTPGEFAVLANAWNPQG